MIYKKDMSKWSIMRECIIEHQKWGILGIKSLKLKIQVICYQMTSNFNLNIILTWFIYVLNPMGNNVPIGFKINGLFNVIIFNWTRWFHFRLTILEYSNCMQLKVFISSNKLVFRI